VTALAQVGLIVVASTTVSALVRVTLIAVAFTSIVTALAQVALIVVTFATVSALVRVTLIVVAFTIVFTSTVITIGAVQAFGGDIRRSSMSACRTSMSAMRTLRNIVVQRHSIDGARSSRAGLRPARHVLPMRPTVASHACTKSILIAEQPPVARARSPCSSWTDAGPSPSRVDHTRCSRTKGQLLIIRTATKIQQRTGHRLRFRPRAC
jgi:hypothetical protein